MARIRNLLCLGCACLCLCATAVRADERRGLQLARRPVTVADTIEMTQWADRSYAAGAPSAGRVGVFSPDESNS